MLLILLFGAGALLASSAALRTACVGLLEAGWDFGNHWLRLLIAFTTIWPTTMIVVAAIGDQGKIKVWSSPLLAGVLAGIAALLVVFALVSIVRVGGRQGWMVGGMAFAAAVMALALISVRGTEITLFNARMFVLIMAFVPIVAAMVAAIWVPPLLWAVPMAVNTVSGTMEKALESLPWKLKTTVKIPRVPPLKKLLWPVALFLIADCLLGAYLYLVPVADDRGLLAVLILVSIPLALLSFFDRAKGLRRLLRFAAIVITIIICVGGRSQAAGWDKFMSFSARPMVGNYNPNAICSAPATAQSDSDDNDPSQLSNLNNPLNIKFSGFVAERGGKDSGVAARDGGTFAEFVSPEEGLRVGKELLKSETYRDLDINPALRKWSNSGYGGEIVAGSELNANRKVGDLSPAELDQLVALMQSREGGGATVATLLARGKNDHSRERIRSFTVPLTEGCFGDAVKPPHFWHTWNIDFVNPSDQSQYVGFWFFGRQSSQGPYRRWNMPDLYYPPLGRDGRNPEWMLQGKGVLRYVQTS
jgi:hypothetical protein